mmetsp:Transcript_3770/g.6606  ORF Transcript_3770/g.6606 Transcript_3770/m.6606 type:complete len:105 (+) Transcript_3770:306-620(+)
MASSCKQGALEGILTIHCPPGVGAFAKVLVETRRSLPTSFSLCDSSAGLPLWTRARHENTGQVQAASPKGVGSHRPIEGGMAGFSPLFSAAGEAPSTKNYRTTR